MPLFSTKPTRNNCPGATWRNWCGLVVLWDKRLLSPHSGAFLLTSNSHLSRPACQPPFLSLYVFFPSIVSLRLSVIKLSTDLRIRAAISDAGVEMCGNDSEGRMKVSSPSQVWEAPMSGWIMWRAPLFLHIFSLPLLLPDCWNSSFCTIANALKLFFLMQMNATGHSAPQKIYSEAKGNQPGRFLNGHRFAVFAVFQLEQQKKTKSEAFLFLQLQEISN